MAANGFAPNASSSVSVSGNAVGVAIPGDGPTLRLLNIGPGDVYVLLAASQDAAEEVTSNNGLLIRAGGPPEFLTVGEGNTFIGILTNAFQAQVGLTSGT